MKIFCYKNIRSIVVMRLTSNDATPNRILYVRWFLFSELIAQPYQLNINHLKKQEMNTIQFSRLMLLLSILSLSSSCNDASAVIGSGKIVTQTRQVSGFDAIELRSHANVEIKKGKDFKVEVSDYENLLPYLTLEKSGSTLEIGVKKNTKMINSKTRVVITMPDPLYSINIKGSGNFYIDSPFNDLTSIVIAGSGDVNSDVAQQLDKLVVKILGSGNVEFKGSAAVVEASIAGSGNIYLMQLSTKAADCTIMGSGDIEIKAVDTLKAKVNGSGNIRYSGNPVSEIKVNGSGRIENVK